MEEIWHRIPPRQSDTLSLQALPPWLGNAKAGGTGLGLSICSKLVAQLSGWKSKSGKGSAFQFVARLGRTLKCLEPRSITRFSDLKHPREALGVARSLHVAEDNLVNQKLGGSPP